LRGHMRIASWVPGELIPCAFVWHDPELPHVAKVVLHYDSKILRAVGADLIASR
jgi:hypothetical protein